MQWCVLLEKSRESVQKNRHNVKKNKGCVFERKKGQCMVLTRMEKVYLTTNCVPEFMCIEIVLIYGDTHLLAYID